MTLAEIRKSEGFCNIVMTTYVSRGVKPSRMAYLVSSATL